MVKIMAERRRRRSKSVSKKRRSKRRIGRRIKRNNAIRRRRRSKRMSKSRNFGINDKTRLGTLGTLETYPGFYENYYEKLRDYLSKIDFTELDSDRDNLPILCDARSDISLSINDSVYNKFLNLDSNFIKKEKLIIYTGDDKKCVSKGTWSGDPIVNFYECYRYDLKLYIYRFGTNITKTTDTGFNHTKNINSIIEKINKSGNKPIICFSLLSPIHINKMIEYVAIAMSKKVAITTEEPKILDTELKYKNENCAFISFPLSSNKKGAFTLFDYEKYKNNLTKSDLQQKFYDLIIVSNAKNTFESIVKVTALFYNEYRNTHTLAYHCKSGKDRTSIFDSVVQATISYINMGKFEKITSNESLEAIRKLSCKFIIFGFMIGYYGTGYFGLKLGSNEDLSKYIFGPDLYKFYSGHSKKAKSSV